MLDVDVPELPPPEGPVRAAAGLRVQQACPACGQADAVVFPFLNNGHPPDAAPLVCLRCCPTRPAS